MIGFIKSSLHRARNLLGAGETGWTTLTGATPLPFSGAGSSAGKTVSAESSMTISAVWACVSRTAQLVSTLPLTIYEKSANGDRVPVSNDLSQILAATPNVAQTNVEYWEGSVAHMILQGNAYSEKKYIGRRLVGLTPMFGVVPEKAPDGRLKYAFLDRGRKEYLPADKIFHLRGFGAGDGMGMSAIRFGANSMGAALAADETAGKVFSNAMMLSGLLSSEQTLTETQRTQLQVILDTFVGSDKAGKILTLEAGLNYKQMQMNPEDAQLLETRRFQVEDVCRWFGTPPIIIGHASEGQTMWGSGVEAIMLSWLTTGINPLLRKIEARISKDLIPVEKRGLWYAEFNREAMLQMDSKAKGEFLSKMTSNAIMSRNEARGKLNLPKRDGADDLTAQTALAPLELLGKSQ